MIAPDVQPRERIASERRMIQERERQRNMLSADGDNRANVGAGTVQSRRDNEICIAFNCISVQESEWAHPSG